MNFLDLVEIKKSFCCEKCDSYEYGLPFQANWKLAQDLISIFEIGDLSRFDKLFNAGFQILAKKDANTKIELKAKSRKMKICLPKDDETLKLIIEEKLTNWIANLWEQKV